MSDTSEPRSWPEAAEAAEALEALKDGLKRVRSSVADFRRKITSGDDALGGSLEDPN